MIGRVVGLGLLFYAGWMVMNKAKAEAVSVTGSPDGEGVADIVARINSAEFGGWFYVADVLAVIQIESSFDRKAYRSEPQINDASRGLMQVLLSTARDRGFTGSPDALYDAETNIRVGMRHLKWSYDYLRRAFGRTPSKEEWIGSYNAGVGNVANKGFIPTGYVAKFRAAQISWQAAGY